MLLWKSEIIRQAFEKHWLKPQIAPGPRDQICGRRWFQSSQILCRERKADTEVHSYCITWEERRGAGGPKRSGFRFLEHWFRCTIIRRFDFTSPGFFSLSLKTRKTPYFFSFSYFWLQCRSLQCTERMHCPWALSEFLLVLIKIRDLLDIWPWAGQKCLRHSRFRFPERLGCSFCVSEHYNFLTCAILRAISSPLLIN